VAFADEQLSLRRAKFEGMVAALLAGAEKRKSVVGSSFAVVEAAHTAVEALVEEAVSELAVVRPPVDQMLASFQVGHHQR